MPRSTDGDGYFWADGLFISAADSPAAADRVTRPNHLAFAAADRRVVRR